MRRPLFWVALCLVIAGILRLAAGDVGPRAGCVSTDSLAAYEVLTITGQVYQKDQESIYLKSIDLIFSEVSETGGQIRPAAESQRKIPVRENIKCEMTGAEELPLGSRVTLTGMFAPFSRATNPGQFDAAEYYRTLNIGGRLVRADLLSAGGSRWRLREGLYRLKKAFRERLYRAFPEKEAAVLNALLLGDKSELDTELKDLYRRNGILHILSISSLHITIIGMGIYKLLRRAGAPVWAAALTGSGLLVLYGCMTGFGVSACRAIGMYLIRMLAELLGRTYDLLIALGVLAAAMVTANPWYLRHSGFLLSYASVLGIGVVYQNLWPGGRERSRGKRSLWRKLRDSLAESAAVSLSITLTTLPIQLWFYYEVPVYSVFLNLLVLPFMKPLMAAGLTVMLLPGGRFTGIPARLILSGYEFLCSCFDRLPFRVWNPGRPRVWQIAVYYGVLLEVVLFCARRKRQNKWKPPVTAERRRFPAAGLACGAALAVAVLSLGLRPPAENRAVFLDVGQGDCILIQTRSGENYLFDCGSSSQSSVGRYVLLPFLKYSGIHRLDAVILSHPDEDHMSGILELFELAEENALAIGQVVLPALEEAVREEQLGKILEAAGPDRIVGYLGAGEGWKCGGAEFLCLHPEDGWQVKNKEEKNAYSLCVYVKFAGGASLLLTGDVEGAGEEALLKELEEREVEDITLLKVAHHGSRNSTSERLLAQIRPRLAVISCGRSNRYGHPHGELIHRLEQAGAGIAQTSEYGAVSAVFSGGEMRVRSYIRQSDR